MDFERKFFVGARILTFLVVLIAATSVVLLERLASSAREVVQSNTYSIKASEEMLALMAGVEPFGEDAFAQRFSKALLDAKKHISHPGEAALVETIDQNFELLLAGDQSGQTRKNIIESVIGLSNINRQAVIQADERVSFFSIAGGWAIVGMTLIGLFVGQKMSASIKTSAVEPMIEICRVLSDWDSGNYMRRAQTSKASGDFRHSLDIVNRLLDKAMSR
jgi:hypothetical protein